MPELLREGRYHPDGQILDEVFEYGSFVQSKMYQQGVRCTDCHEPHRATLRQTGNALCTTCHQENPPQSQFPTLRAQAYDTSAHHFHQADSPGAQCVNCHMPSKNYMVIDPRRDHSIRIPRPDLSIQLGVPNACTSCHTDQEASWAVTTMNQWYGAEWQNRPHFASTLAAGRAGDQQAVNALSELARDASQPLIVRATALDQLARFGEAGTATLMAALTETAPLLRAMAVQGLTSLPDEQKLVTVAPLLHDPVRAVRIMAPHVLATIPPTQWDTAQYQRFSTVLAEYQAAQLALADQPEGYANLGNLYTAQGEVDQAENAYKTTLALDSHFWPAANSLAILYAQTDRLAEAVTLLQAAITTTPNQGELYYSLGLLLVQQQKPQEAVMLLAQAVILLPNTPRVHYNYGLLLQQLGRLSQAEAALLHAYVLSPTDADLLYALAVFYLNWRQPAKARPYVERLVQLYPNLAQTQQLIALLKKS